MSGGATKKGGEWEYKIYFDARADQAGGPSHDITDEVLIEKLKTLVDVNEKITKVTIYKLPLSEWQLTDLLFYHNFIIFETKDWWWSIEKNGQGITIQRSKSLAPIRDYFRQEKRNDGIKVEISDEGKGSVGDLIEWLYKENELNKPYHYVTSNCQIFARAVFNHVARTKKY